MARVRIKDIAEIANVSTGTVDRVIHHRGEVSRGTRERIQKNGVSHHYPHVKDLYNRLLEDFSYDFIC